MYVEKFVITKGNNNQETVLNNLLQQKNKGKGEKKKMRLRKVVDGTMIFTHAKKTENGRQIVVQGSSKKYTSMKEFIEVKKKQMENRRNDRWRKIGEYSMEERTKTIYLLFLERNC